MWVKIHVHRRNLRDTERDQGKRTQETGLRSCSKDQQHSFTIPGDLMETRFLGPLQAQFLSQTFLFSKSLEDTPLSLTFPASGFHSFSWQSPSQVPSQYPSSAPAPYFHWSPWIIQKHVRKVPPLSAQSFNANKVFPLPLVCPKLFMPHLITSSSQ